MKAIRNVCALLFVFSTSAMAHASLCEGNYYVTASRVYRATLSLYDTGFGRFEGTMQYEGGPVDRIVGQCDESRQHMSFTRYAAADGSVQTYSGTIQFRHRRKFVSGQYSSYAGTDAWYAQD